MSRIVVAGGGIAGLSIAHALQREAPEAEVILLEAHERVGGNIRSERVEGYLCEWGPDGFLDNAPATLNFVQDIGLSGDVLRSSDEARRRFIFRRGRLNEVPMSPGAFITSGLLSPMGKLRILAEPFARRRPARDESIHEFAERRIGREAAEVMVGSMVSGIFAGDAHGLSLRACFPKMWEMENDYGSLFHAMIAKRRERKARGERPREGMGSPTGTLTSFTNGMEDLVRAASLALGKRVRLNSPVLAIRERRTRGHDTGLRPVGARSFSVLAGGHSIETDALVLAGPSSDAADLIRPFDSTLAGLLASIRPAPLAVVCLGYDEAAVTADRGPLNGFGFLVPRDEGTRILGALWETSIYANRAPAGKTLIRVMIGGGTDPDAVDLSDAELLRIVRSDLETTMGIRIAPEFVRIIKHHRGIPQYTTGHTNRLARIDTLLEAHPGLFVAGNSYRGVSINSCIAEAPAIAARVTDHLRTLSLAEEAYARAR